MADAVLLISVTDPLPGLLRLNLKDNPLNNHAHQFIDASIGPPAVEVDANAAPVWQRNIGPQVPTTTNPLGSHLTVEGLDELLGDLGNDWLVVGAGDSSEVLRYQGPSDAAPGAFVDVFAQAMQPDPSTPRMHLLIGGAYGTNGDLYVADLADFDVERVYRFDGASGELLQEVTGVDLSPTDLAAGPDGHVYFTSSSLEAVVRIQNGDLSASLISFPLQNPGLASLAFGPDGNMYVSWFRIAADGLPQGGVDRYDVAGDFLSSLIADGGSHLTGPLDLAFAEDGSLYVVDLAADMASYRVRRFDADGNYLSPVVPPRPTDLGNLLQLRRPRIEIGPDGLLYLADPLSREVLRFDRITGQPIDTFVTQGSGALSWPSFLAFASADPVYQVIADAEGVRGAVVDGELTVLAESGFTGRAQVTVIAGDGPSGRHDFRGRTAEMTFDYYVDASTQRNGAVYGRKFDDRNQNGYQDAGEPGLENWTIYLDLNADGHRDADEPFTRTDANGNYALSGPVGAAAFIAEETQPYAQPVTPPNSPFVLHFEAEDFTRRVRGVGPQNPAVFQDWLIIDAGAGLGNLGNGEHIGAPGGSKFANASGGFYMQVVPDSGNAFDNTSLIDVGPKIEYEFRVPVTGTYQLSVFWDGFDGGSNSLYASIPEARDGIGGDQTVREGDTVSFTNTFTDPATADDHTFLWRVEFDGQPIEQADTANFSFTPPDDGKYTVILTVEDGDGGSDTAVVLITAENVVPENVAIDGNLGVYDEGSLVMLSGRFDDPGTIDVHTFLWRVQATNGQVIPDGSGRDFSFTPADEGTYDVTFTVEDHVGGASTTIQLSVHDAAPIVTSLIGPTTVDEGQLAGFTAVALDPGSDALTYEWDFDYAGTPAAFQLDFTGDAASHTFSDDGLFLVAVRVRDDLDPGVIGTLNVTVGNVAPAVTAAGDQATLEGESFDLAGLVTFADPGFGAGETFAYTVDWGDGSPVDSGTALINTPGGPGMPTRGSFDASHVYADNGDYTVALTVEDDDGGTDTATWAVHVNNVAPTVTPAAEQFLDEGGTLILADVATFTDPGFRHAPLGSDETFIYTIDWGDGSSADSGVALIDSPGEPGAATVGSFDGSHTYVDNGVYPVTLTVTDDDGGGTIATITVTVNNVAPTVALPSTPDPIQTGDLLTVVDGFFIDPGADTWQVLVDYFGTGDFTSALRVGKTFKLSRVYDTPGAYPLTVKVRDDDGGESSGSITVTVTEVVPSAQVLGRHLFYNRSAFDNNDGQASAGLPQGSWTPGKGCMIPRFPEEDGRCRNG